MIIRGETKFAVRCIGCGAVETTQAYTIHEAIEFFKDNGWLIDYRGSNFCPLCHYRGINRTDKA